MATEAQAQLTYDDIVALPERRRELIGGELIVTPSPSLPHQQVVGQLFARLHMHCEEHGGVVAFAPLDVYLDETNVVQPDILFVRAEDDERIEEPFIRGAPDVVVEVSSPSTRRLELIRKRELYESFAVPEYWYIDREAEEVYVDRLVKGEYSESKTYRRGDTLESPMIPGFKIEIDYLLGPKA